MFRNKPFTFVGCLILCPIGVGLVLFFLWWLEVADETLFVSEKFIVYRQGIFTVSEIQIYHGDISQMNVHQTLFQRFMRVGTIEIGSSATDDLEIHIDGIRRPKRLKAMINDHR